MLIGLVGRAGSGKDTVADVLRSAGWQRAAFADALRIEVAIAWRLSDLRLFSDRALKERPSDALALQWCSNGAFAHWCMRQGLLMSSPRSPRWVMQHWGTWRRTLAPLYWVQQVEQKVMQSRAMTPRPHVVITDVRFDNEAYMVRWLGGRVVRVHRPDLQAMAADTAAHCSEQHSAIRADAEIHNDGDLHHLAAETLRVLRTLDSAAALETAKATGGYSR